MEEGEQLFLKTMLVATIQVGDASGRPYRTTLCLKISVAIIVTVIAVGGAVVVHSITL